MKQRFLTSVRTSVRKLRLWTVANGESLAATGSLAAIAAGCWMAWPPLGLIIPGAIVFLCLASTRLRG
jgi:hypothetical protein